MPQAGGRSRAGRWTVASAGRYLIVVLMLALQAAGCRTGPVRLLPPAEIQDVAGQASFYLSGPDGAFRFRLGFCGRLSGQARLELFDPLGRLRAVVWLSGERAALYLPSEKVYWQGASRVLTSEIFGRELKSEELVRIISGRWPQLAEENGWLLRRDDRNRVLGGEREGLVFILKENFAPGLVPKTVHFSSGAYTVRMKVLRMDFNRCREDSLFNPAVPPGVRQLEWEEMAGRWKK